MHAFVPTRRRLGKAAIRAALALACAVGLVVCAGLNEAAAAQRGSGNKATWGATKAPASKFVRDHRTPSANTAPGGVSVKSVGRRGKAYLQGAQTRRCNSRGFTGSPEGVCRDHRK
jgi:hypothetical protein